jgi:hypothetical protein
MPLTPARVIGVGIVFLVALSSVIVVRYYYTWHMAMTPEPSSGRTIAVEVNFGKTVYVSPSEQKLLYGTYVALTLALVAATAIAAQRLRAPT